MDRFEWIVVLLAIIVALGVLAKWLRWPYPIVLVIGGLLLSLQPGIPSLYLPPDIVMLAFLPILLYSAAFNTHWPSFRKQARAISLMAVGLVLFTTSLVAVAAHEFLDLPWSVGFLLGAIVSPPDAIAASAIMRHVRVPRIITTLLEGESLVNDASALVAYRVALAAVFTGSFDLWKASSKFLWVGAGGAALGLIGAILIIRLHSWLNRLDITDAKLNITITLLTPYAVYLPAEHLHLSGVMASVTAGLWIGTRCTQVFTRDLYHEARAVWESMEFILNGLIFILIGFQLRLVLETLSGTNHILELTRAALIISGVLIASRILWVFPAAYIPRWVDRKLLGRGHPYPAWTSVLIVGWTGMRGVVSLAAAMAIPLTLDDGKTRFPHRDMILFLTFWVIFATLVGQGLTLPLLIRWLGVDKQGEPAEEEESLFC